MWLEAQGLCAGALGVGMRRLDVLGLSSFHKFKQDRQSLSHYSFCELGMQDRQCTYNVTLRCLRATIVSVGKSTFSACICRIRYTAGKTHLPYCHCDLLGSTVFFLIISQTARFSKNVIEHKKFVLMFSTFA
jgi:hypothetical protein